MLKKITKPLIIGGVFYLVGFYSCLLIKKWTVLNVNNQVNIEINPLEILSLGITVLLAIYVTRTLSKKNDLEKNEKDLLINYQANSNYFVILKYLNYCSMIILIHPKPNRI